MSDLAFLLPEEVPAEHRESFDYHHQYLGPMGSRNVLKVVRYCSYCPGTYEVSVTNIRGDLKRGRKMRPGKCRNCRGRIVSGEGYVLILKPDHPRAYSGKYVPEHILVMEESLGRLLDPSIESVHHIDGDRQNNEISNLQLRTRYHGKGQAWECQDCGSHNVKSVTLK